MIEKSYCHPQNYNKWLLVQCYYTSNYENFTMPMHSHSRIEIMYVNYGEMFFHYSANGTIRNLSIKTNEYILIDADVPHKITIIPGTFTQTLNLELELFYLESPISMTLGKLYKGDENIAFLFDAKNPVIKMLDDGTLLKHITNIQEYIGDRKNAFNDLYIDLLAATLIAGIAKSYKKQSFSNIGIPYLKSALHYINENYPSPITSKNLAKIVGVSQNYLNKLFVDNFNKSIVNYINTLRIERAVILMKKTSIPLEQIYKNTGFHNKQNFHKHFLRVFGISPAKYQKTEKVKNTSKHFVSEDANIIWNIGNTEVPPEKH